MFQNYYIKEVMDSMGWSDPSHQIPIADTENKKLLETISLLANAKSEREAACKAERERLEKFQKHLDGANVDFAQNMKLLHAYQSQVTDENHLLSLAEREFSKLKVELGNNTKEFADVTRYEKNTDKDIKSRTETINKLYARIKWAKSALAEWNEAMKSGDQTNKLIERYCKDDETRAKELETKRRMLQNQINSSRKSLIEKSEEMKSLEQALDRSANLYRQMHLDRRQMVDTWKTAVKQMNQREEDIEATDEELALSRHKCRAKEEALKAENDKLNELLQNNKEIEATIKELNDESSSLKEHLQYLIDTIALKENEVDILRKELQNLAQRVQQQRQRNKHALQEKAHKEEQLKNFEELYNRLVERHDHFLDKNCSAQDRLRMLEEMVEAEEKIKAQIAQETTRINGIAYRSEQQLIALKDEEKVLSVQNHGLTGSIAAVKASIKENHKEIQKQTEIHYNMALKVQLIEARIAKIEGSGADPEEEFAKQAYLVKLEKKNEDIQKKLATLKSQSKNLDEAMKKLTICYNNDMKEIENMNFKIKEAQLYCEGGMTKCKQSTQKNQERIVDLSILKMRVSDLENQIIRCKSKAYSLEKHQIELNKTVKERLVDIKAQMELLFLKRKHLMDQRGTLICDIGDRVKHISAAKKRFELATELMGKNDDGSVVTAVQLKVQTAQEKQMLIQEGNELNEKVLKAEDEIKAMENTLCLLNYGNKAYKKTFEKVEEDNPDVLQLKEFDESLCEVMFNLKNLKVAISKLNKEINEAKENIAELQAEIDNFVRNRLDNNDIMMKIHKELIDQKVKLQRADREVKCVLKLLHQRCFNPGFLTLFEKDIHCHEIEKRNSAALNLVAELLDNDSELAPKISRCFYENGLKIPCRSQMSWRSDYSDFSCPASKDTCSSTSRSSDSPSSVVIDSPLPTASSSSILAGSVHSKKLAKPRRSESSSSSAVRVSRPTESSSSVEVGSVGPSVVSISFPSNQQFPAKKK